MEPWGISPDLTRGSHDAGEHRRRAPRRRVFPGPLLRARAAAGAAPGRAGDHAGRVARVAGHRVRRGACRADRSAAAQAAEGLAPRTALHAGRHRTAHAQQRPAGSRTAAQAGEQGLHRAPGRAAPAADQRHHDGAAGRYVDSPGGRPAGLVGLPAADHGDLRAARRAGGRPGRVPGVVGDHRLEYGVTGRLPGSRHRDDRLLPEDAGRQAARARRRPAVRAGRGAGRGGQADRGRAAVDGVPAAGGRARDHGQPDRQRHARAAAQPRGDGPAARRPVAAGRRGGGTAPVREPGEQRDAPVRGRAAGDRRPAGQPGRGRAGVAERRRTATRPATPTPTGWTWAGTAPGTWRSATASTTAWARRWPGWRPRSRSAGCWSASAR